VIVLYAVRVPFRVLGLVVLAFAVGACASLRDVEERTTQGPAADELWLYHQIAANGREPTFDERLHWRDQLDERIARYLRAHPEASNSLDLTTFRFERRAIVGMTKEQILLLLGRPLGTTSDPAEIEKRARRFWPLVREQAQEAWAYPLGWTFYFAGDRVVDITRYASSSP
jgi:hypothetical protein